MPAFAVRCLLVLLAVVGAPLAASAAAPAEAATAAGTRDALTTRVPTQAAPGAPVRVTGRYAGRGRVRVLLERRTAGRWTVQARTTLTPRRRAFALSGSASPAEGVQRFRVRVVRRGRATATRAFRVQVRRAPLAPPARPAPGAPAPATPAAPAAPATTPLAPSPGRPAAPAPGPAPATVSVPPARVRSAPAPDRPGEVRLDGPSDAQVGDVLVASHSAGLPHGLLVRVTGIRRDADGATLDVVPATIPEAFPDGSFSTTFPAARRALARSASSDTATDQVTEPAQQVCPNEAKVTVNPGLGISLQPYMAAEWHTFSRPHLAMTAAARITTTVSMSIAVSAATECSFTRTLIARDLPPVQAGPVLLVPHLELRARFAVAVEAEGKVDLQGTAMAYGEVRYRDGDVTTDHDTSRSFTAKPTGATKVKAEVVLEPIVTMKAYGVVAAGVGPAAGLEGTIEPAGDPWWKLDGTFAASIEATLHKWGSDWKFRGELFKLTEPLAKADGPFGGGGGGTGPGGGGTDPGGGGTDPGGGTTDPGGGTGPPPSTAVLSIATTPRVAEGTAIRYTAPMSRSRPADELVYEVTFPDVSGAPYPFLATTWSNTDTPCSAPVPADPGRHMVRCVWPGHATVSEYNRGGDVFTLPPGTYDFTTRLVSIGGRAVDQVTTSRSVVEPG
jgi:hypothetical protein